MLHRALDETYPAEVRGRITLLTVARTTSNACFRFTAPFLATVASGLGVSLDTMGIAIAVSELSGLLSPVTGSLAERLNRRTAMAIGLTGVGLGAALAAASQHVVMLAVALVVLAQSKVMFDLGLGAWVSDRVPYERRGRVLGLTETSWALGLLLGVTAMGLVAAAVNWRAGYALGAVAVLLLASLVARGVDDDPAHHRTARAARPRAALPPVIWVLAAGMFCLMAASQMLFVTFGSWLEDRFGFSAGGVAAVVFGLGFAELTASLSAARVSDWWGKERAGGIGAAIMIPAASLLAVGHGRLAIGLPLLIIAIAAFEFAIVSLIPLGTEVVPGAPALGMSVMFAVGTLGRAIASIPATRLYVHRGIGWPSALAATLAFGTVMAMWRVAAMRRR